MVTDPTQLHRAVANALYPLLRAIYHGLATWPLPVAGYRLNDPTGKGRTGGHSTATGIPGPIPRSESLAEDHRLLTEATPESWPGHQPIGIRLWKTAHDNTLHHATPAQRRALHIAYVYGNTLTPFTAGANRHGTPVLRRNYKPEAGIAPPAADLLEAIAAAAEIEIITPALAAAFITDDDTHGIRATETFAIAQRAGIEPPEQG